MVQSRANQVLRSGETRCIISETVTGGGQIEIPARLEDDAVLVAVFVDTITSGTLTISVQTFTANNKVEDIIEFPQITAPTTNLILRRASIALTNVKFIATYTGDCTFEVHARGISQGEANVRVVGSDDVDNNTANITSGTPQVLIPSSLIARGGFSVKNFTQTESILYIGISEAKAAPGTGYPLEPGESVALDIGPDVTLYASSDDQDIDVRIFQLGT